MTTELTRRNASVVAASLYIALFIGAYFDCLWEE